MLSMEIIGRGLLARNLHAIAHEHAGVTAIAAGVSTARTIAEREYLREAELVADVTWRCLREGRTLVFFSTASPDMYGAKGCHGREDEDVFPRSRYGRHKLALEDGIKRSGASHLILRVSNVVGAGQAEHQLLPALARQVRSGSVVVYRGARRDLIDVTDVVTIIHELLGAGTGDQVVNIASGAAIPVGLIVDYLEDRLGRRADRVFVDRPESWSVSLGKLRRLVSSVAAMGFGHDYYRSVIDRYVKETAPERYSESASDHGPPGPCERSIQVRERLPSYRSE
jgi:nucleoside-diphosphate-sugar epimerase